VFFQHFQAELAKRNLKVVGVTTDGSTLYPSAIAQVFGVGIHQVCEFHVLKELNKAILSAVAKVRKTLIQSKPKLPRGRPSNANHKMVLKSKRLQIKIEDLFTHRYLFVERELTSTQQHILHRITRGLPQLRALRTKVARCGAITDEIYKLFESGRSRGHRRCRMDTALAKLSKLRHRVRPFKTLNTALKVIFSPNLEKALTFLDDKALPATSNAVERGKSGPSRGHRRFRKMQQSIYSVRTKESIDARLALDLQREDQAIGRNTTNATLHLDRSNRRNHS